MMKKYFLCFLACSLFVDLVVAAPSTDAYGRLPEIEQIELSPSGKRYAFIATTGEKRRLGVVENGKAVFAGDLGDIKTLGIEWVGEERLLLSTSTTFNSPLEFKSSYELCTMMNIDLRTGKIASIFERTKKIAPIVIEDVGTRFVDGKAYKYFIGMAYGRGPGTSGYFFDGDQRNLYRVDLETSDITQQAQGGLGPGDKWAVAPDGRVAAHSVYESATGAWRLYAGADKKKLLVERVTTDGRRSVSLKGLGRSADTVWVSDVTDAAFTLDEISLADGRSERLLPGARTSKVLRDLDSGLAIGTLLLEEPFGALFDAKLQARFVGMRRAFPGLRIAFESYSRNFDRMIARTDGGDDSGTFWLVDIASGAAESIGRMYPEVRPADIGPVSWVRYSDGDGKEVLGRLTLPPGRKAEKLPVVVLANGLTPVFEGGLGFDWLDQAFASAGYAVFKPGVSTQSEADPSTIDYRQLPRKEEANVSNGLRQLIEQGLVDTSRMCTVGLGLGGYSALAAVTVEARPYRCAVAVAAPAHLPAHRQWLIENYGFDSRMVRFWRTLVGPDKDLDQISPAHFAGRASAPVLLIHGKNDTILPLSQSEKMASALRSADKSVELVVLEGEDHDLARGETRKAMLRAAVEFVKKNNPPN